MLLVSSSSSSSSSSRILGSILVVAVSLLLLHLDSSTSVLIMWRLSTVGVGVVVRPCSAWRIQQQHSAIFFRGRYRKHGHHHHSRRHFSSSGVSTRTDNSNFLFQKKRKLPTCRFLSSADATVNGSFSLVLSSSEDTNVDTVDIDLNAAYQELQFLSNEIRRHDAIYYGEDSLSTATTAISDDEYDALVEREAWLCRTFPHLFHQWQRESGLGVAATRYGGRVGSASIDNNMNEQEESTSAVAEEETAASVGGVVKVLDTSRTTSTRNTNKRQHLSRMLSLDNVHSTTELLAWLERVRKRIVASASTSSSLNTTTSPSNDSDLDLVTIMTEPKLDGLGLSLRYGVPENEKNNTQDNNSWPLLWAATRGDGRQGIDVTAAVREMTMAMVVEAEAAKKNASSSYYGVPERLFAVPKIHDHNNKSLLLQSVLKVLEQQGVSQLEIRGEVILPTWALFILQSAELDNDNNNTKTNAPSFSNARNAAAGILLRKQIIDNNGSNSSSSSSEELKALRAQLRFYAYEIVITAEQQSNTSQVLQDCLDEARELLRAWGFAVPQPAIETTLKIIHKRDDGDDFEERQWNESDIAQMLDYHAQLQKHRLGQNDGDNTNDESKQDQQHPLLLEWGDYDMDGCVHKVKQTSLRQWLGASNRAPRWATAHKFPSQSAVTALLDVTVQVGRTGALTPVAVLQPVQLAGGVTVRRATLHNYWHMQQVLLGNDRNNDKCFIPKGSLVMVRRAGDVIPQVVSRIDSKQHNHNSSGEDDAISLEIPTHCPACGSDTVFEETKTNKTEDGGGNSAGRVLRCGGPALLCPPRSSLALQHAYSRDALYITGLSDARIRQLMDVGMLKIPSDVFSLAKDAEQLKRLEELEGWGTKSAQNLASVANRVASDGVTLARFIYSLGIRSAGIHSSELVAAVYGNVDAFLRDVEEVASCDNPSSGTSSSDDECFSRLREENELTKGLGPVLISSLVAFSKEKDLVVAARELEKSIVVLDDPSASSGSGGVTPSLPEEYSAKPLQGMTVVFTGSIPGLARSQAHQLAKDLGARSTPNTVSKSTDLVVFGEKGGKKLEQAERMGVRTMGAEEFQRMENEHRLDGTLPHTQ